MDRVDVAKLAATAERLRSMIDAEPVADGWPDDPLPLVAELERRNRSRWILCRPSWATSGA